MNALARVGFTLLTSLFAINVWAATFTVTVTTDVAGASLCDGSVPCSLRQAILNVNASPGPHTINFNMSGIGCDGNGVCTIQPTALLDITQTVTIDGYTQPAAKPRMAGVIPGVANEIPAKLKVVIDGSLSAVNGLRLFRVHDSIVKGLVITKFGPNNATTAQNTGLLITDGMNNVIVGNYIGPDVTGLIAPNMMHRGINVNSSNAPGMKPQNHRIGGPAPADRNVLSGNGLLAQVGNSGIGVQITGNQGDFTAAEGNQIIGNLIGVGADGTSPLGNKNINISTSFATNNTLIDGNVVKYSYFRGIQAFGFNFLGAPPSQGFILRNNDIENNASNGILFLFGFTGALVENNRFINNAPTATALGMFDDFTNGTIQNNVVGGSRFGISILFGSSHNNTVQHNWVGIDKDGTNIGNSMSGINIGSQPFLNADGTVSSFYYGRGSASNNLIANNVIAFNHGAGVVVGSGNDANDPGTGFAIGNSILGNSIYSNDLLGIDLTQAYGTFTDVSPGTLRFDLPDGVTLNHVSSPSIGANHYQNFPVLDGSKSFINPEKAKVYGYLNSQPNKQYRIEIFGNDKLDATGYGEGRVFLAGVTVTTNATGHVDFKIEADRTSPAARDTVTGACVPTPIITATATDLSTGDTSEFSQSITVPVKGNLTAYPKRCNVADVTYTDDNTDATEHLHDNDLN